jgi:hypothetical protein
VNTHLSLQAHHGLLGLGKLPAPRLVGTADVNQFSKIDLLILQIAGQFAAPLSRCPRGIRIVP